MPSNKFHWLELAEWATLGVGVIGAVITKQFIMAGVPLTVALSLNIINQKRLQRQIGHERTAISKIHQDLQLLNQQVQVLPDQKVNTDKFNQSISGLKQDIQNLTQQFNNRIETEAVSHLTNELNILSVRLDHLPTSTEIDLDEIEKAIAETRRTMAILVQDFHERPEKETILQIVTELKELKNLPSKTVDTDNFNQSLFRLEETIQSLSEQFNNRIEQQDILRITNQLTKLEKDFFQNVLDITNQLNQLEESLSQTVSNENFNQSLLRVRTQLEESIVQEIPKINQQLKEISSVHQYELVCNRDGSRNILLQALRQANERLILVCPWLSNYAIDDEIILMLKQLLNRNVYVDIGWGHLNDMQQEEFERGFFYNALPKIEELERMYPNKCKLKLLGTHEKFLVCDNKFAMIGSHNFLMSGTSSSEREIGIFTNDIHIISSLIERFDTATNLENQEPRGELEVQAPSLVAPPAIPALVAPPAIQEAEEAGVPQFCVDQIAAGDGRITFEASDLEQLTNRVWNVYEDTPGVFQMQLQLQGHCLGAYELQPLPAELATIESEPGYFTLHGYILELAVEVPADVAAAMSKFAEWSKANKGVKNAADRPYLFYKVTSAEALVQLVVTSSYNKSASKNELSFNGWAYQGIEWGGTGIGCHSGYQD